MVFEKAKKIEGELTLPGDKSISHRAVLFAAMAKGVSTIYNLSNAVDVQSSIGCVRELGVQVSSEDGVYTVESPGLHDFTKPEHLLDAGNSGTTARLISGMLINGKYPSELTGDDSLHSRPMKRIIEPLEKFGAVVHYAEGYKLPVTFSPAAKLKPIEYHLPIASAQIKSAVLIAGLALDGETIVYEKFASRDHTERMLGLPVTRDNGVTKIVASNKFLPKPGEYHVPGDISTAAFFIVAVLCLPGSSLTIKNVTLNPTRTGFLTVLRRMGADITILNERLSSNEPIGDIHVKYSQLKNVSFGIEEIPNIIDEIPILAVAGAFASGPFEIRGAGELRVKESDRITSILKNLKAAGLEVEEYPDGFGFEPGVLKKNAIFESNDDHRIAMAFAVLSLLLEDGGKINNFECVKISNPDFLKQINSIVR